MAQRPRRSERNWMAESDTTGEVVRQANRGDLAAIAHDLRNALNVVEFSTSCALDGDQDPTTTDRFLHATLRSVRHAQRLVRDLTDAIFDDRATFSVQPSWVSASQLMADARAIGEPLSVKASLTLRAEIQPDLPLVWADTERITQVFVNLIGNAARLTPVNGHITVSARPQEHEVHFVIADTGPGFTDEARAQLHQPPQEPSPLSPTPGLGLSICRQIIEAHGGRIWIEDSSTGGALVAFALRSIPINQLMPRTI